MATKKRTSLGNRPKRTAGQTPTPTEPTVRAAELAEATELVTETELVVTTARLPKSVHTAFKIATIRKKVRMKHVLPRLIMAIVDSGERVERYDITEPVQIVSIHLTPDEHERLLVRVAARSARLMDYAIRAAERYAADPSSESA